jgi:L-rhamnose mutarotase
MPDNLFASIAPFVAGAAVGAACMFLATRPRKMTRLMQSTKVRADKLAAYKKFHASVWPEVEAGLLKYGITTLSIWGPSDGSNDLKMYMEWPADLDIGKALGPDSDYMKNPNCKKW